MSTYYAALGVSPQASAAEIRRAYRQLVLLTHPDRTTDPIQHRQYLAVNEAYETLSDPLTRASYDAGLARPQQQQNPVPETVFESHPDPAMRRRGFRRRPPTKAETAARAQTSYPAQYARYMPLARRVNWVLLLFALLLLLDSQWTSKYEDQEVRRVTEYVVHGRKGTMDSFVRVETPDLDFRLDQNMLQEGERIDIECSALFKQVRVIWPAGGTDPDRRIILETFYDLLFLPVTMAIVAAIGCWPPPGNRRIVDTATMALVLAVIHVYLLLRS